MNASKFRTSDVAILGRLLDMDLLHRHEPSIRQSTLSLVSVTEDLAVFCRVLPCVVSVVLHVSYKRSNDSLRPTRLLKVQRMISAICALRYSIMYMQECDLPADRPYVFGYHPHGRTHLPSVSISLSLFQ